jgi:two-component system, NtrC family, response regulator GlrR
MSDTANRVGDPLTSQEVEQLLNRYASEATSSLFEAYGVTLSPADLDLCDERGDLSLLGIIRFTGPHLSGSLMLGATDQLLRRSMPKGASPRDWIAELTNQLIGRVKNKVLGHGIEFYSIPPAVMSGQRLSIVREPGFEPLVFAADEGFVCTWMDLEIPSEINPDPSLLGQEIPKEGEVILFWTQGVALQPSGELTAEDTAPTRRGALTEERNRFGGLVGQSSAMRAAYSVLEQAAASEVTVLIQGDTGTGKEACAEAIHRQSRRRHGPFVVVDCGSLSPQLLESELFGHERGSFTGAVAGRKGAFEAANGGTIFLDEIGELGVDLQPKLLRALERKEIKPVGSNAYRPVDVRVLAATNRDLVQEVAARRFRSDLYFRLAVLIVRLPALRERLEDLPLLIEHMLEILGATDDPYAQRLRSEAFIAELRRHPWRGNVRELRNHIERCLVTHDEQSPPPPSGETERGDEMRREFQVDLSLPFKAARERCVNELERRYLAALLEKQGNRVSAAARVAGVDRIYFYRLLRKHGLRSRESPE